MIIKVDFKSLVEIIESAIATNPELDVKKCLEIMLKHEVGSQMALKDYYNVDSKEN